MPIKQLWNWQQKNWPLFRYDSTTLEAMEAEFLKQAGMFSGAIKHVENDHQQQLTVELICDEAFHTSEIEGEILNRDSLQSSIRRNFGLATDNRKVPPAENGIAQMMVELYRKPDAPLTHELLFHWHELLMNGRRDLIDIGRYRTDENAMQVVSGPLYAPKVHFEAPPSRGVPDEMRQFIEWFARTSPGGESPLPVLTRTALAHLHFVCVHPFEDGNGRIGRAIAEKCISEGLRQPTLIALSMAINRGRKHYYERLEHNNKHNEVTDWLLYFAKTILGAQAHAQRMLDFLIAKTKFYDRIRNQLNPRQDKAIARMMREGPQGFEGGMSAEKYIRLTDTSRATATRDLQDLVEKKAFLQTGNLKSTRYHLNVELKS